jgi:two-component system, chemotaxis family, chemotaxis protein CheY
MESASTSQTLLVLVVDDDPDARDAMAELLQLQGFSVLAAGNGHEALEVLKVENPNVVLLDLMMPVVSGWEFLRRRKAHPELARIPVIVTSAVIDRVVGAQAEGADAVLLKPINIEKLLNLVKQLSAKA